MWISKRSLKDQVTWLENELKIEKGMKEKVLEFNNEMADKLMDMISKFPFELGQTVYDLQLRSSKGRFTKTKPSREHSLINEVVVDKRNYFNLVERYNNNDVFKTYDEAEKYLVSVCVE